jgi:hypothetical protein
MGIISRHANAPYQDGEILSGADLETDIQGIFTEFNGNISAANIADSAVSTAKIAANAVIQSKMTSGAASASEAQVAADIALTAAYQTVGAPVVHVVGNPARHVIVIVSCSVTGFTLGSVLSLQLLKDGVSLTGINDVQGNSSAGPVSIILNRTYVDLAPTAGGTHTYTLQAKHTAASATMTKTTIVIFEPRS